MTNLEIALSLAGSGFKIFPLEGGTKIPVVPFKEESTTRASKIRAWFWDDVMECCRGYDVGIYTENLLVVDVDVKNGKDGSETLRSLTPLPGTLRQFTENGGEHHIFRAPFPVSGGNDKLGPGLDVKASGGFIKVHDWRIATSSAKLTEAPAWLVGMCGKVTRAKPSVTVPENVNAENAEWKAVQWLAKVPGAVSGIDGNSNAYKTACRVKDFGVSESRATEIMLASSWNERCEPPWSREELATKVRDAYKYGKEAPGIANPQAVFSPISVPVEPVPNRPRHPRDVSLWMNEEYAFVLKHGKAKILRETRPAGRRRLRREFMEPAAFHAFHAAHRTRVNDEQEEVAKWEATSKVWFTHRMRRSYHRTVFCPGPCNAVDLNLYQGFEYDPVLYEDAGLGAREALDDWIHVVEENLCLGDETVSEWVLDWMADSVQNPGERPQSSIAVRSKVQGIGKTSTFDRWAELFGPHSINDSDSRYLTGNFNAHLEQCLVFIWDEAESKQVSAAKLRQLISASHYQIEPKGVDSYTAKAYTRWVLITNDPWVVKANEKERRYCILGAEDRIKKGPGFYKQIRLGMEANGGEGYGVLLDFLRRRAITSDLTTVPNTAALTEQKELSLEPLAEWWLECLREGSLSVFGDWPKDPVEVVRVVKDIETYYKKHVIGPWKPPAGNALTRFLRNKCPSLVSTRENEGTDKRRVYRFPNLEQAREDWDDAMGSRTDWEEEEVSGDDGNGGRLW